MDLEVATTKRCRACLLNKEGALSLYDLLILSDGKAYLLTELFSSCSNTRVSPNDKKPQYLCLECTEKAKISFMFKLKCQTSESILNSELCVPAPVEGPAEDTNIDEDSIPLTDTSDSSNSEDGDVSDEELLDNKISHKVYPCGVCGKIFKFESAIWRHKEQFHRKFYAHGNNFPCEFCGKVFTLLWNLDVHRRTHTGDKPYSCTECGKCFVKRGNLDTHKMTHVQAKDGNAVNTPDKKSNSSIKPFKCHICNKSFTFESDLRTHIKTHTGEHPYTCAICDKKFVRQAGLTMHMRIHNQ